MSMSLSRTSIPLFEQMLGTLSGLLDKGTAYCAAKKVDEAVMLQTRLAPDMLPLVKQFQISADFCKNTAARLAGIEPPKYADDETSFSALKARIDKTIAFVKSVNTADMDAAPRDIVFPLAGTKMKMKGDDYLYHFALPNVYFHAAIAHAILRSCGIDVGKRDYMGAVPGMSPA